MQQHDGDDEDWQRVLNEGGEDDRGQRQGPADAAGGVTNRGRAATDPWTERPYSGKLNLRLGPHLHRRVALEAAEAGLSINSYLVRKVS